jgi:hypothetical protein
VHWLAFAVVGTVCGVAGGIFAFANSGRTFERREVAS